MSQFLPIGNKLAAKRKGKLLVGTSIAPPMDYGLIEKFIAEEFNALEVIL